MQFPDMGESTSLAKWSSLELLAEEDDSSPPNTATQKNQRKYIAHKSRLATAINSLLI